MQRKNKSSVKVRQPRDASDLSWDNDQEVQATGWNYADDEPDLLNFTSQYEDSPDMRFFN